MTKKNVQALTNKEILIGYCTTLSEKSAGQAYKVLEEFFGTRKKDVIKFNADGTEDKQGYVRLRHRDVRAILENLGEDYFKLACNLMHNYMAYVKEQAVYNSTKRAKFRELSTSTHYLILTKGWVAQKIEEEGLLQTTQKLYNSPVDFFNINTIDEALTYINGLPSELRLNNPEINYLLLKFPQIMYDTVKECWNANV